MKHDCALMVFAKAPVAGFAKSRLATVMGAARAARLAARMLDETLRQAIAANIGAVELHCTPDTSHPAFEHARKIYRINLNLQLGSELGVRMSNAFSHALQTHRYALLIGTDLPELRAEHIRRAAEALAFHDAVFIPVSDGGYGLVGLSRHCSSLFDGVDWGTTQVMQQTRERLASLKMTWFEMPTLHDVDDAEDLVHVPAEWLE